MSLWAELFTFTLHDPFPPIPAELRPFLRPAGSYTTHIFPSADKGDVIHALVIFHSREELESFRHRSTEISTRQLVSSLESRSVEIRIDQAAGVFDRPIIIVGAPRAGTTLLREVLAEAPNVWSLDRESHHVIETIPELHPSNSEFASNALTDTDLTASIRETLTLGFYSGLRDRNREIFLDKPARPIRFLEKTPKNVLRIPFLNELFPDAFFVFLLRDPRQNVSSIMEFWRNMNVRKTRTYDLPGWKAGESWSEGQWSLLLIPGWRELNGQPLASVAARQWITANSVAANDIQALPPARWTTILYDDLVADPKAEIRSLLTFLELESDDHMEAILGNKLKPSHTTLTEPQKDKWLKNAAAIDPYLEELDLQWNALLQLHNAARAIRAKLD